jgi:lipid-binding SYLF domain-containing protein
MKKMMFVLARLSLSTLCWAGSARDVAIDRLDNATDVMHAIMGMPDKGIPEEVLKHAKCVAVVPHVIKGGFVFGAMGGKGVATCRTGNGWSAPAFFTVSGGTWGLQIGVEAVDVVAIFQNDKAMRRLLSSNFQIGADASAAAGTDWKLDTEILTYSRAKGAFAGLTVTGASVREDNDSRHAMYGPEVTTRALLLGEVPVPAEAQPFLEEIRVQQAASTAQAQVAPSEATNAEISVTSNPSSADIELDGAFVGNTPSTIGVSAGDHTIDLHKSGYTTWERKIKVTSGKVDVSADLEAAPAPTAAAPDAATAPPK